MILKPVEAKSLVECYSKLRGKQTLSTYCLHGKEGNRTTYTAKLTFNQLVETFELVPSGVLPETVKIQRDLIQSRTGKIKQYISNNKDFVFPAVIAVVESMDVSPSVLDGLVSVTLQVDPFRYLVDGQGRLSGIKLAIQEDPSLGSNTIDVKFIISQGVESDAQLFSDINTTPTRPNRSQCVAMDSRSVLNSFAKQLVQSSPILSDKICYSKASVTKSATGQKLWTLNQVTAFVLLLTGLTAKEAEIELNDDGRIQYWTGFINAYLEKLCYSKALYGVLKGDASPTDIRQTTIIGTSVFFKSLALFGKIIMLNFIESGQPKADWSFMDSLRDIDLSVSNLEWRGRCQNYQGRFEDKAFNHRAMASYLCDVVGINKPDEIAEVENHVISTRMLPGSDEAA
jgi:DGQHR domain-containing protein